MIQQAVARLLPLSSPSRIWIITNEDSQREVRRQLPRLKKDHIVAEPVGRNTAPAIGLAAYILLAQDPDAVLGLFPSDHVIGDELQYRQVLEQGIQVAARDRNLVVLGIKPMRPETGYGYIESAPGGDHGVLAVRRFTEKPDQQRAEEFIATQNYFWNSGMFLWSARTLTNALREHLPQTATILEKIAGDFGTSRFAGTFRKWYPKCENISVDYAILEPRSRKEPSNIFCLPADFGWNDLGSWPALHEHDDAKRRPAHNNQISGDGTFTLNSEGNYVHAPGKFVAVVGVKALAVVATDGALLIASRAKVQDVGKVVKHLDAKKMYKLV